MRAAIIFFWFAMTSFVSAQSWHLTPHGSIQPAFCTTTNIVRGKTWSEKINIEGIGVFVNPGLSMNPVKVSDFLLSSELLYHSVFDPAQSSFKKHGLFLLGKVTLPIHEGYEGFLKIGLGGFYFMHSPKDISPWQASASCMIGANIHLGNKWYVTTQVIYFHALTFDKRPDSKANHDLISFYQYKKRDKFSLSIGLYYHS
jgi:hypothetical protein